MLLFSPARRASIVTIEDISLGLFSASPTPPAEVAAPAIDVVNNYLCWLTHPDNPAKSATMTFDASVDDGCEVTNLQSLPAERVWRTFDVSFPRNISIDFGEAIPCSLFGLVNHNLTEDAIITLSAGEDTTYSGFSMSLQWAKGIIAVYFQPQTYRYWNLQLTDTANVTEGIEAGYLALGRATVPEFNFRMSWQHGQEFCNQMIASPFGVPNVTAMSRRQQMEMQFGPITYADMAVLETLYATTHKDLYPLILMPERNVGKAIWARISNPLAVKTESHKYTNLTFIEDGYGRRI